MSDSAVPETREQRRLPATWRRLVLFVFFVAALFVIGFRLFDDLANVLVTLVLAFFVSLAMEPAVNYLNVHRGWRRGLATGAILATVVLFGLLLVGLMIPVLIDAVQVLTEALPRLVDSSVDFVNRVFGQNLSAQDIQKRLIEARGEVASWAASTAFGAFTSIVGTAFSMFTMTLFAFYFTAEAPSIRRAIASLLPPDRQQDVLKVWEAAIEQTGGYIYSRGVLAFFNGMGMFIVMSVLGVPFAIPLALFAGVVSQFIPIVGTYIAGIVPVLVALTDPGLQGAVILVIWIVVYQQIENYLLSPRIAAKTMTLHPAVAFFAAMVGGSLGGVVWAFLALPMAAVIQFSASLYVRRHDVVESELTRAYSPPDKQKKPSMASLLRRRGESTKVPTDPGAPPEDS
jgi:predicted PurR-regulated permease PerM